MTAEWLSTDQAAERVNASAATIQKWCREGWFPNARRLGNKDHSRWMIPAADLERWQRKPSRWDKGAQDGQASD